MASEALADAPDEATIREMHSVLRLMELCLRNVDMPSNGDDEIVGWAPGRALSRLQSRLLVLRSQATSAHWSPSFLKVLKRARSLRTCPLTKVHAQTIAHLADDDEDLFGENDSEEEGAVNYSLLRCSACRSTRGLQVCPEDAFELICNSPLLNGMSDDDAFLLTCNPNEIHQHVLQRFQIDSQVGKAPEFEDLNPKVPRGYRGLFATGPKCHVLACVFVWLQNFLPNVAYLLEGELSRATPEELKMPASEFSVVTDEMAKALVLQLEKVETLLREDIDRAVARRPPPSLTLTSDSGLPEHEAELWERVHNACWRATENETRSPRGKGVANMRLAEEEDGWAPLRPSWHRLFTGAGWDLEAYILYLNRRLRSKEANLSLALGHNEEEDGEEEDSDEDSDEDDEVEDDEVVVLEEEEEEEKEDERTRRRKRRSESQSDPQPPERKTRPKRRAVVEDNDDDEVEEEQVEEEEAEGIEVVEEQSNEAMLYELICNAHEEAAADMRRAAAVADAVGMRDAHASYQGKMESARHLQRAFGLGRIV